MRDMPLSEEQRRAVEATEGPVCIIAGPGSGKTYTIIERMAYLIDNGVPPREILTLTFTNKAAGEMRERFARRMASDLRTAPTIETFHAFALSVLRTHGARIGLTDIVLVSEKEERELTRTTAKQFAGISARDVRAMVTAIKNGKPLDTVREKGVVDAYARALRAMGKFDFDDIMLLTLRLFEEVPDVLEMYARTFTRIMVDEYQDTSVVQIRLLFLLAVCNRNICVIGDPDQAIYGFRGASPDAFERFEETYRDARVIRLTKNYRSRAHITAAAQSLLSKGSEAADADTVERVHCLTARSAAEEAKFIVSEIVRLTGGTDLLSARSDEHVYHLGDIAVTYRSHAVGKVLKDVFTQAGIPASVVGEISFFEWPEIRGMIELLRMRSVSKALSAEIAELFDEEQVHDLLEKKDLREKEAYGRLRSLLSFARTFDHLSPGEAKNALLTASEVSRPEEDLPLENMVTLLTAHAAKGLEFPIVFVAGAEDGIFPYLRDDTDVEEEKRLFYVAMTRAKERLYLTCSKERYVHGTKEMKQPSRFINMIAPRYIASRDIERKRKKRPPQTTLF